MIKIIPKIDKAEALKEYLDHNPDKSEADFDLLWDTYPKSIRIVYGWLLAYKDVFDWLISNYFENYNKDIYIYPAFTKNACVKNDKIYFNVRRDFNHHLAFGIIVHELMHIIHGHNEEKVEEKTREIVRDINKKFGLKLDHGQDIKKS